MKPSLSANPPVQHLRHHLLRGLAMLGSILVAVGGAELWRLCHLPLPWLVGTLYAVAFARICGVPLLSPPGVRQGGQWVIGINIGLYFTSAVVAELLSHVVLIVAMALGSLLMGFVAAAALVRWRLADAPTAFFAAMPGGAAEMAHLGDLWHAAVDSVAAAHAIRVMLVVFIVPLVLTLSGSHGADSAALVAREVVWQRFPLMLGASLAGVLAFTLLRLPNAWILGTIAAIAALGIGDQPLSALPGWVSAGGQLLIGVGLGSRFEPGFQRKAPAFLGGILVMTLAFLLLVGVISLLVAAFGSLTLPNLVLSFSPGGIAEMSITASQLHLAVPLVVAAHVARVVVLTVLAPSAYRLFARLLGQAPRAKIAGENSPGT